MGSDPRNPALEDAILADPEDANAFMVLADWLEGLGDPRAQLIRLTTSLQDRPNKDVRRIFANQQKYLFGPLAAFRESLTWRYGFIHDARILDRKHLEMLLQHPSGRFLVELYASNLDADQIAIIVERCPRSLRKLSLRAYVAPAPISLAALWSTFPSLESLDVHGAFELHGFALPRLTDLSIGAGETAIDIARSLHAIAASPLPCLRKFTCTGSVCEPIYTLLGRHDIALEEVSLFDVTDETCQRLAAAPSAATLRMIKLGSGAITRRGVEHLVQLPKLGFINAYGCDEPDDDTYEALDTCGIEFSAARFRNNGE